MKNLSRIEKNRLEFERLKDDVSYKDVAFNAQKGGLMATHVNHNFDKTKGGYERDVQNIGFTNGHAVVFEAEPGTVFNQRYAEGTWNDKPFEIGAAENGTSTNIKNAMNHCASKPGIKVAVVYFPNKNFDKKTVLNAIARWNGLGKINAKGWTNFD